MGSLYTAIGSLRSHGYFYQHNLQAIGTPLTHETLMSIRSYAHLVETTLLCRETAWKPLDNESKTQTLLHNIRQFNIIDLEQLVLMHGPAIYDAMKRAIQTETTAVISFWEQQQLNEFRSLEGLLTVMNRISPLNTAAEVPHFFFILEDNDTTYHRTVPSEQRYTEVVKFYKDVAEPFLSLPLLPCSENFSAWIPVGVLKDNYRRITNVLTKIEDAANELFRWQNFSNQFTALELDTWKTRILDARRNLESRCLLISRQPDDYAMGKLKAEVEILANSSMNLETLGQYRLRACILNDQSAQDLQRSGLLTPDILRGGFDVEEVEAKQWEQVLCLGNWTRAISVTTSRPPTHDRSPVLRQKYYLLIYLTRPDARNNLMTWAATTPFVYITHSNQKCEASQTLFWHQFVHLENHFSPPTQATVSQISNGLINYCKHATGTARDLPASNQRHLLRTIFSVNDFIPGTTVEFEQLGQNREAWSGFYKALILIEGRLKMHWERGLILGFESFEFAEDTIRDKELGSFVIRFSNTKPGYLAITVKNSSVPLSGFVPREQQDRLNLFILSRDDFHFLHHWDAYENIRTSSKWDVFLTELPPVPVVDPYPLAF